MNLKKYDSSSNCWTIESIANMMASGRIPAPSESGAWTEHDREKYVDSVACGLSNAPLTLALDASGRYHVIDGWERLIVVRRLFFLGDPLRARMEQRSEQSVWYNSVLPAIVLINAQPKEFKRLRETLNRRTGSWQ